MHLPLGQRGQTSSICFEAATSEVGQNLSGVKLSFHG